MFGQIGFVLDDVFGSLADRIFICLIDVDAESLSGERVNVFARAQRVLVV